MKILTASLIIIFLIIALPYLYRILELEKTTAKILKDIGADPASVASLSKQIAKQQQKDLAQ